MSIDSLVLDSLLLPLTLTRMLEANPTDSRLQRVTGKSWARHWRRVNKAIAIGMTQYTIPEGATTQ